MSYCFHPNCSRPNSNFPGVNFCTSCGTNLLLAGRYRATKQIGQGGFGKTFLAVDEQRFDRVCVIKQLLPQAQGTSSLEKAAELFEREAKRLDELGQSHPQIPELLAYFTQDSQQYLIQEFIAGQDLADEIAEKGAFTEPQIIALLNSLLPVLEFVHSQQVIHRDIKPENLIRRPEGQLVLVDFGAAKMATRTTLAITGTIIGTPGYAAPEQLSGKPTYASDVYSLGVTCLTLLTQVPSFELFDHCKWEWVWRNYSSSPVSDKLGQVLDKMVESALQQRYQSATEVLQALNPAKVASTIPQPTQPATPKISSPPPDNLSSEVGVDYTNLQNFLRNGRWREADEETGRVMLEVSKREEERWLREQDIKRFPCTDLRTIDQLWVKYSKGRFGFSVQKCIFIEVGGKPMKYNQKVREKFGDRVSWRVNSKWLHYRDLAFRSDASVGHLPAIYSRRRLYIYKIGKGRVGTDLIRAHEVFSRLETCNLEGTHFLPKLRWLKNWIFTSFS